MSWLMAAVYDRFCNAMEEACLTEWRQHLLGSLRGAVLEVGAGTGVNVPLYPDSLERAVDRRAADGARRRPPVRRGRDRARSATSSSTATPRPTTCCASCSSHLRHGRHGARAVQAPDRVREGGRGGRAPRARSRGRQAGGEGHDDGSITMIPIIELCRYSPGMVTAMGVSMGLTAAAIMSKGTIAQKERWVPRPAHPGQDRRLGDHRARAPAPTPSAR
jgi:hypothetical protein